MEPSGSSQAGCLVHCPIEPTTLHLPQNPHTLASVVQKSLCFATPLLFFVLAFGVLWGCQVCLFWVGGTFTKGCARAHAHGEHPYCPPSIWVGCGGKRGVNTKHRTRAMVGPTALRGNRIFGPQGVGIGGGGSNPRRPCSVPWNKGVNNPPRNRRNGTDLP